MRSDERFSLRPFRAVGLHAVVDGLEPRLTLSGGESTQLEQVAVVRLGRRHWQGCAEGSVGTQPAERIAP